MRAAAELGAEGLQGRVDPSTKEAFPMCSDALKKAVKVMAIIALVLVVLAVAGLAALYFTLCGGHPHGLC
ncbi:hypothetical protein D3C71_1546300 [compost metagenome]